MNIKELKKELEKYNDESEVKFAFNRQLYNVDSVKKFVEMETNLIECVIFRKEDE